MGWFPLERISPEETRSFFIVTQSVSGPYADHRQLMKFPTHWARFLPPDRKQISRGNRGDSLSALHFTPFREKTSGWPADQ